MLRHLSAKQGKAEQIRSSDYTIFSSAARSRMPPSSHSASCPTFRRRSSFSSWEASFRIFRNFRKKAKREERRSRSLLVSAHSSSAHCRRLALQYIYAAWAAELLQKE